MSSFTLIAPAGWIAVDPRDPDRTHLAAAAAFPAGDLASDTGQGARAVVTDTLRRMCTELAARRKVVTYFASPWAAISLYRPIVAIGPLDWGAEVEPLPALLAAADENPTAVVLSLRTAVALRMDESAPTGRAEFAESARLGSDIPGRARAMPADAGPQRQHQECYRYWIGMPSVRDSWVEALCIATVPDEPCSRDESRAVREAFDALVCSYRWMP